MCQIPSAQDNQLVLSWTNGSFSLQSAPALTAPQHFFWLISD
jgi:hypothetical protein